MELSRRLAASVTGSTGIAAARRVAKRAWSVLASPPELAPPSADAYAADFDATRELWLQSILTRPVVVASNAGARAWRESAVARHLSDIRDVLANLPRARALHAAGVFVLAAVLSETIVSLFDPRPASAWRWLLAAALTVSGALLTLCSEQVAVAWDSRRWSSSR